MIVESFDPMELHDVQKYAVGQEVLDIVGNRWGYMRIREASGGRYRLMRSTEHTDVMSAGVGVVAAAEAIGSTRLTVAATTNRDFREAYLPVAVGCLGTITTGAGVGQSFWITARVSATEVQVQVIGSNQDSGGWNTALTTASRFSLFFPGEARQGDGTTDFVEGVLHEEAASTDVGKYGYVQRSGLCPVTIDASGNNLGIALPFIAAGAGLVQGMPQPGTANAAADLAAATAGANVLGRVIADQGSDAQVLAMLNIPGPGVSRNAANKSNAFNDTIIGGN